MSDAVIIRRAGWADRETIGELWWEMMTFHHEHDPSFFQLKPKAEALEGWLKYLDECLADENQIVLIVELDGKLAGFVNGRLGEDPPAFSSHPHGFITNFTVSERFRRRGVGRKLYDAVVEHFRKLGVQEVRLAVSVQNSASNAFWRELGFEPYRLMMRKRVE